MEKHDTLLICSPIPENRVQLRQIFAENYNLLEADNSSQAIFLLRQNAHCIAAVVLDVCERARMDTETICQPENRDLLRQVPVIIITRDDDPEMLNQAFHFGASDVIPIDYEIYAMRMRVANIVELHLHKQHLETMIEEQSNMIRHSGDAIVDALSSIIEYRSVESGQHIRRIRFYSRILLEEVLRCCPEYSLTDRDISLICGASGLHDIGKIAIPDAILTKPGALTEAEWEIMKTHSETGCRILDSLNGMTDPEYLHYARQICYSHHERWDGNGYPQGLKEEEIPIAAQVVGLVDAYDALTSKRVYKDAFSFAEAVNMILRGDCGTFSPKLLECFKHVAYHFEELARDHADGKNPAGEDFSIVFPETPEDRETDGLDRTTGKYYALVHYINGFLMELDMDKGLFHLIYNPYPELFRFRDQNTLGDLYGLVLDTVIHPGDRERMDRFLLEGIPAFLEAGLRRASYRFRMRSGSLEEGEPFELTLLRINPLDAERRTLAILGRKLEDETPPGRRRDDLMAASTYCCLNDQNFTLVDVGAQIHELAGYSIEEIQNRFGGQLLRLVHPEDRDMVRREMEAQLKKGVQAKLEHRVLRRDGSVAWLLNKSRLYHCPDGQEYLYCNMMDITETRAANEALRKKLNRYEIILSQTENVLFDWDLVTDRIDFSDTLEQLFGFVPVTKSFDKYLMDGAYFHPDDFPLLIDRLNELENGSPYEMVEVRISTSKGRYLWCRIRATAIRDANNRLQRISGIIINIDAEKRAERILQDRAERDPLTKLLNKRAARKQAEEYFARFPQGADGAMLIIDLDNFKQVNDHHGHLFGDAVLTQVAREIRNLFRSQDIVARVGGDEFLVLMRGVSDHVMLENRCQRLVEVLGNLFRKHDQNLLLSCSIGVARSPEDGTSYIELFQNADRALYQAKAVGKNRYVFWGSVGSRLPENSGSATALRTAIDSDLEPGLAEDSLLHSAIRILYSAEDPEKAIREIIGIVGRKMNVSRVYIFENSDDNSLCSNTYEWCNQGILPVIDTLQDIGYERDIPGYEENFDEEGVFYCPDISVLPVSVSRLLEAQNIRSMLQCAFRESGEFRGFMGFDECVEHRMWTKQEIRLLRQLAETISVFLRHIRRQKQSRQLQREMEELLDEQNAWIYLMDPDSFTLHYRNSAVARFAPDAQPGTVCYRALMGREEPCPGCPALEIREKKFCRRICRDLGFGREILAEAELVRWNGEELCRVSCRELPGR